VVRVLKRPRKKERVSDSSRVSGCNCALDTHLTNVTCFFELETKELLRDALGGEW